MSTWIVAFMTFSVLLLAGWKGEGLLTESFGSVQ